MNHPEEEQKILEFWRENDIFQKSLEKNPKENKFVFYEGPPTANGKPGVHHVLTRSFKDIVLRYKTMRGFYVKRRAGWDTHGLPVEIEVEKFLGISGKKDIEKYGIAEFNQKCRESVWKYKEEWEKMTERIGFWIDMENPYITYENPYIEKVWSLLKSIYEKDLIYSGFKVVPYCPRCGTTLSSHEVAQGYKNIEEESIYVKLKIKNPPSGTQSEKREYFLVWTTTPWTLPGNIALAIGQDIQYVKIKKDDELLILAKDRLGIIDGDYEIIEELSAQDIEGLEYEPLYDNSEFIKDMSEKNFKIYSADFVTTKEGTGIVHIAPAFGEDDMNLQNKVGLSIPVTVGQDGKMLTEIGKDKFVKDADSDIKADLETRGLLTKKENIKHDYPFCWRCDSILIYYARSTWFIAMSKLRDELIKNNKEINWVPAYIKEGRFGEWLREVKDWAISRERYWGTPIPLWKCDCGNIETVGSFSELKEKSNSEIKDDLDLHKPYIDEVKIKCSKCGNDAKRIPEVLDVWFDSGSMPFSSGEYPGNYPADFISEAIDQTRGWFYTMLAISTLMDQKSSYKNVICLSHVLDEKGKKMSKSKGNIIEPNLIIDKFGADSLRWYFYTVNNPGDPKRLGERSVEIAQRRFINILWNVFLFFETYSKIDCWDSSKIKKSDNILDKWIESSLNKLTKDVTDNLEKYDIVSSARIIEEFITEFSTWYLRRSRKRRDEEFYSTIYQTLQTITKIIAPFVPFISESIYQKLKTEKDPESVHLCDFPKHGDIDEKLLSSMQKVRELVEKAHALRAEQKIKVRQPLASAKIKLELNGDILEILQDEINVKEIIVDENLENDIELDFNLTDELKEEGFVREIQRQIQDARKKSGLNPGDKTDIIIKTNLHHQKIITKNKEEIATLTNINNIIFEEKEEGTEITVKTVST